MFEISFLTTYTFDKMKLVDAYIELEYDLSDMPTTDEEWRKWLDDEIIDLDFFDKYCYMKDVEEV